MKKNTYIFLIVTLILLVAIVRISSIKAAGTIPGTIQSESYDAMSGVQTETCSEGGLNVAWVDAADWMDYNVTVQTAGTYTVNFRVASPYTNTQLQLKKGTTVLATVTIPNTGNYQTWATVTASVSLTAGSQTLRVYAVTNGWNINWMSFTQNGSSTPTATKTPTATPTQTKTPTLTATPIKTATQTPLSGKVIPGKIEAEIYDAMLGIQTETCSEGGANVSWVDAGDWMDYNVTVQTTGAYTVDFRVASPYDNTQLQLKNGSTILATVTIPNTGGYQNWSTVSATVNLNSGSQTLRVYAVTNGWNLNWINFSFSGAPVAVTIPVTGSYVQYLQIGYSPADLNGNSSMITQNANINHTVKYNTGSSVTVSVLYMVEQKQIQFRTTNQAGQQIQGNPLTFTVHSSSVLNVDILDTTPTPSSGTTPTPISTPTPTVTPTSTGAFQVLSPINGQMITTTRTPVLSWQAKSGTSKYEVWINTTRTDYDWNASGNLLNRYTKVGETTGTTYTAPSLVDRWTYKWYAVAVDGSGNKSQSNIGQFSVYLPYLEQVADGINIVNGSRDCNKNGTIEGYEDWHLPIQQRIDDLMSRMSDSEKLEQLFYSPDLLDTLDVQASFVYSYGTTDFIRNAQIKVATNQRLGIPIGFMGDMIHGWQTIYPTQLGLAATRNLNTIYQCGDLQRREHKAGGFTGTLAPLAEVDTKVLYPRFQEGCGENADFAAAMLRALICGMQGGPEVNPKSMLVTVKHWPSQGAGGEQTVVYDGVTIKWHMKPWYAAMDANCGSIMPGYGGSIYLDPTGTGACDSKPTIDYLRNTIGFKGMICTDWLAAATENSIRQLNAGCDVMGGAVASGTNFSTLISSVGWTRLNESVRRVLDIKFRLGMFENPYNDPDYPTSIWHSTDSQNIVTNAAKQSLTLLKNNGVLPLRPNSGDTLVVGGPLATADDLAGNNVANSIWSCVFNNNPLAKTYYQGIKDRAGTGINVVLNDGTSPKAAVIVIGEHGYTHGTEWTNQQLTFPADQMAVIDNFYNRGIPVVAVVITPRPYILTDIQNKCAAIVLAYRPGNGGGQALAQLLFGDYTPTGKLPFQLPRSVSQVGTNVTTDQLEKWDLPYDLGATDAQRTEIRNYINNNQAVPTTYGDPLYPYGFGLQAF